MPEKIQLHIADPCHEDWDHMSEAEKGRFCGACRKQVIDFSEMSDRGIVQFFKRPSTGSVCGRFMSDQLDRDMVIEKKRLPWIKYFFQFVLPAFLLGKQAQAQTGGDRKPATGQMPREYIKMGIMAPVDKVQPVKRTLHIRVKNAATGEPVPYASIMVSGDEEKKVANDKGLSSMNVISKGKSVVLTVSSVGYKTKTIIRDLQDIPDDDRHKLTEVELEIDPLIMEDFTVLNTKPAKPSAVSPTVFLGMVTVDGRKLTDKIPAEKITTKEKLISRVDTLAISSKIIVAKEPLLFSTQQTSPVKKFILPAISTRLYPNPVKRGEALTIEFESNSNEAIMVKLIANDGKTLIIHKQPISNGNNRFTIDTGPAWTAGVYFLVFSNEKGILIKTEELLIQ